MGIIMITWEIMITRGSERLRSSQGHTANKWLCENHAQAACLQSSNDHAFSSTMHRKGTKKEYHQALSLPHPYLSVK